MSDLMNKIKYYWNEEDAQEGKISLKRQIILFLITGFISFFIDFGTMTLLKEVFHFPVLAASGVSFVAYAVSAYIMSVRFVYNVNGNRNAGEFSVFVLLSAIGWCLSQGIMFVLTSPLNVHYMLAKPFATGVVMIYNYITRKLFLERRS